MDSKYAVPLCACTCVFQHTETFPEVNGPYLIMVIFRKSNGEGCGVGGVVSGNGEGSGSTFTLYLLEFFLTSSIYHI